MIVGSSLSTGELMSLLTYCMNILMSLMMLSMVFVMITMSLASARRISEVLNEKSDLDNPENPDFSIPDGSITFDHVYFNYKKGAGEPVLSDINLSIQSGETIGIIGGTGSAKTSLVNLISRLYDVTDGSVKVGGKDVRSYDMETLRNEVAVVLQKNSAVFRLLFSTTSDGVIKMLRKKSASVSAVLPAPMNLSTGCRRATTPTSSRADPTYPAARNSASVSQEHC